MFHFLNFIFMEKEFPFPCFRTKYKQEVPDPLVKFVENDESTGSEVIKELRASAFYQQFPLAKDAFTLQDYIDAGIPLREVPIRLYESQDSSDYPFTQDDLYNYVKDYVDNYNKEEK